MSPDSEATPSIADAAPHHNVVLSASSSPERGSAVAVVSDDDATAASADRGLAVTRPRIGSRKSSGTMIVNRDQPTVVDDADVYDEGDVRTMSPRRSSDELERLSDAARRDLVEQAKLLQTSLQQIVDRVETVREEHEKLEGGNKFLQS